MWQYAYLEMAGRNLGRFLREQRESRQLSQNQVAAAVGISHTYVSKIEQGHVSDLGRDVLRNLAGLFDLEEQFLESLLYDRPIAERSSPRPEPTREVAAVQIGNIAAGPRGRSRIEHWEYVPLSQTRGRILRAAVVDGDCMGDEVRPGDTVLFDQNPNPRDGQLVVAVLLDEGPDETGQGVLKRFFKLNGKVKLAPNVGDPIIVAADRVRIEGVVVEVRRRYAA
jgi:transcriptional regulator with XRE-family HTH domain